LKSIDAVLEYAAATKQKYGFQTKLLSIGGGFGAQYVVGAIPPPIADFAGAIIDRLTSRCREFKLELPKLMIEPGRKIVATAGVAIYTVGVIKDIADIRTYVSVDGGMGDNIRQPMYGAVQEAIIANKATANNSKRVTISGKYCEAGDVLIKEIELPELKAGDILAVAGSGAYCVPMQSNYNANLRPAIIFVKDGKARLVRRRETLEDLTRRDVI
jgi:diaminopimelate decarboxylase